MERKSAVDLIYGAVQKIIQVMTCLLLTLMVIIVFSNVIARYYLEASIAWSEELSRFMLIWLVFLGSVLAYVEDEHLGLDILVKRLPRRVALVVAVLVDLLVIYASYLLITGGYTMAKESWDWQASSVPIPYGYVYIVIPLSAGLMLAQTILKMALRIRDFVRAGRIGHGQKEAKAC